MNGQSKRLDATSVNIDSLYKTGIYFITGTNSENTLGTYPSNSSGFHLISSSQDSWEGAAKLQIIKGFSSDDEDIYFRVGSFNPTSQLLVWSKWQLIPTIEKICNSYLKQDPGYIVFGNQLGNIIIQWGWESVVYTNKNITYPLSFKSLARVIVSADSIGAIVANPNSVTFINFSIACTSWVGTTDSAVGWFVIGF